MKRAVWAFVVSLLVFASALVFVFARGEDTRRDVQRITVDPCGHPRSDACQRRIRLVLRELVRRHPGLLRRFDVRPRRSASRIGTTNVPPGGGGSLGAPTGGGPIGRVPSPGSPPADTTPPSHQAPEPPDEPAVSLDAPLVPKVCVGDLLGVNC